MAKLRDWLNKNVLVFDIYPELCCISVVHQERASNQRDEFGQLNETIGKLELFNVILDIEELDDFLSKASHWLNLPLSELANTYFHGQWHFVNHEKGQFSLSFERYQLTPSKTDWFTVVVSTNLNNFIYERSIHIDRSALENFVGELKNET